MGVVHGLDADWVDLDNDPLVRRLRGLQWADVPSDVRSRCWERISTRMSTVEDSPSASTPPAAAVRDTGERYDFTRRLIPARLAVAHGWSRRPSHVPALAHARPVLSA